MNQQLINIAKEIYGKSDAIVSWKPQYWPDVSPIPPSMKEKETKWFSTKKFDSEVKRVWIYTILNNEKMIKYIGNVKRVINDYQGEINTLKNNSKFNHTYKLEILYRFKKPLTLQELKKYKHKRTKKSFRSPQGLFYVSSYPELLEGVMVGKIY